MTRRRAGLLAFASIWLVAISWSLASPLLSGPDEPAHLKRAYSLGRGEVLGPDSAPTPGTIGTPTVVELPRSLGDWLSRVVCFAGQSDTLATCDPGMGSERGDADYATAAGRYPPLYSLPIAVPLVASPTQTGVYGARLVGAALFAALIAASVTLTLRTPRPWLLVGVFAALTPMTWFLAGTVNPSSLEIAAAITLWVGCLIAVDEFEANGTTRSVTAVVVAVAGSCLALTRGLGPLWLVITLAFAMGVALVIRIRGVLGDRRLRYCGAVLVGSATVATAWIIGSRTLEVEQTYAELSSRDVVAAAWHQVITYWRWIFGTFGWLDTNPPDLVPIGWAAAWILLLAISFSLADRWMRLLIVALIGAGLFLPIVLQAQQWNAVGPAWQGRYSLPLLVGVPVLSGWVIDRSDVADVLASLRRTLVAGLGTLHIVAFYAGIRRYAVGARGPAWILDEGNSWLGAWLVPVTVLGSLSIAAIACGVVGLDPRPKLRRSPSETHLDTHPQ